MSLLQAPYRVLAARLAKVCSHALTDNVHAQQASKLLVHDRPADLDTEHSKQQKAIPKAEMQGAA